MIRKIFDILKTILLLLFMILIIFFAIKNNEIVKIDLIFYKVVEIRLFLLIIFCLSIGCIIGIILSSFQLISNFIKYKIKKFQERKISDNKN